MFLILGTLIYETSLGINTDNYTTEEILDEISNLESQNPQSNVKLIFSINIAPSLEFPIFHFHLKMLKNYPAERKKDKIKKRNLKNLTSARKMILFQN